MLMHAHMILRIPLSSGSLIMRPGLLLQTLSLKATKTKTSKLFKEKKRTKRTMTYRKLQFLNKQNKNLALATSFK